MNGTPELDAVYLQSFKLLRSEVLKDMEMRIEKRLAKDGGRPNDFELELDALKEEIEPQVWNAIKVMNKKGYVTASSGFAGKHGERQQIDGEFFVDRATREKLATMGVAVLPYPDGMLGQMIVFAPDEAFLPAITAKWNRIAELLPNLNKQISGRGK